MGRLEARQVTRLVPRTLHHMAIARTRGETVASPEQVTGILKYGHDGVRRCMPTHNPGPFWPKYPILD